MISQSLNVQTLVVGQLQTNCYIVSDSLSKEAVIIDPGDDGDWIIEKIISKGLIPSKIFLTHGHFDHALGAFELQVAFNIPLYLHYKDRDLIKNMRKSAKYYLHLDSVDPPPKVTYDICDNLNIQCGKIKIVSLHTPGHTQGSVSFYIPQNHAMFTGDSLFKDGGIGRTDFVYSDQDKLRSSIQRILSYPQRTILYPGHGPRTSIRHERIYHVI